MQSILGVTQINASRDGVSCPQEETYAKSTLGITEAPSCHNVFIYES